MDVAIIDSGGANLASVQFALERLGASTVVTSNVRVIELAPRIILPGVGSASHAMGQLLATGVAALLPTLQQPVLGICLGMQLLFSRSEEGGLPCLGILPQLIRRLSPQEGRPIPHMGWNALKMTQADPLLKGIKEGSYCYFAHSYAAAVGEFTLASVDYGVTLSAIVRKGNFWGTQFHPERSSEVGARLLQNFLRLPCN